MRRRPWTAIRTHGALIVLAACGVLAVAGVGQHLRATARASAQSEGWRSALATLVAHVAESHLWLEERLAGDGGIDATTGVVGRLERARGLCRSLLAGGGTPSGRVAPVPARSAAPVAQLCRDLRTLADLTGERLTSPASSAAGTGLDRRYDAVFLRAGADARRVGRALAADVRAQRRRAERMDTTMLAALALLVVAMGLGTRRYVRERLARQGLETLALTDALTGLGNHRHFHERLDEEVARGRRTKRPVALVALDLDHFKHINDAHGHPVGDEVLRRTAAALREVTRAGDVLARVGGEEFALLLPEVGAGTAVAVAERARAAITAAAPPGVPVRASAGVAVFPQDAEDATTLLDLADGALYAAKSGGRDRTRRYDARTVTTGSAVALRAEVLKLLREPHRVVPVFQPIVSLGDGRVVGFEALARFEDPAERSPLAWFELARRFGLGAQLEALAIERALASADTPHDTFLSLNVSPSVLASRELAAALPEDLTGIVLEITEHESLPEDDELGVHLDELRRRGARIAVDDAGAGYAGLQAVMRLSPDVIKLDRGLIEHVDRDPAKAALVEALAGFAERTGSSVCAEGIETKAELDALAALAIGLGQGYYIARPAPAFPRPAVVLG